MVYLSTSPFPSAFRNRSPFARPRGLDLLYFGLKRIYGLKELGYTKSWALFGKTFAGEKKETWPGTLEKKDLDFLGLWKYICIVWDFVYLCVCAVCVFDVKCAIRKRLHSTSSVGIALG
jgi:hypothetical protein